jgi:hypothetical protein
MFREESTLLKFYFNKAALESLAKEVRRGSWGAAAAATAIGFQSDSGLSVLLGASAWIILQILAFVLESIRDEKGDRK